MPVKKFFKLVHSVVQFSWLFPQSLISCLQTMGLSIKKIGLKSLQIIRTISGLMPSKICHKWGDSIDLATSWQG